MNEPLAQTILDELQRRFDCTLGPTLGRDALSGFLQSPCEVIECALQHPAENTGKLSLQFLLQLSVDVARSDEFEILQSIGERIVSSVEVDMEVRTDERHHRSTPLNLLRSLAFGSQLLTAGDPLEVRHPEPASRLRLTEEHRSAITQPVEVELRIVP